MTTDKLK